MLPNLRNNNPDISDPNLLLELSDEWNWEADLQGTITYVSANTEKITGYSSSYLLGKSPADFLTAKSLTQFKEKFKIILKEKREFNGIEMTLIHKNGIKVFVEICGRPILDSNQQLLGIIGICRDITKYKLLEKKVAEEKRKYKLLSQLTSEALIIHGRSEILEVNNTFLRMFEYESNSEIIGKNPLSIVAPQSVKEVKRHIDKNILGKYEFTAITKDKKSFLVEASIKFIKYRDIDSRLVCIRDITQERRIEAELLKQVDLLKRFKDVTINHILHMKAIEAENAQLKRRLNLKPNK